jgi:hypothetical protein
MGEFLHVLESLQIAFEKVLVIVPEKKPKGWLHLGSLA